MSKILVETKSDKRSFDEQLFFLYAWQNLVGKAISFEEIEDLGLACLVLHGPNSYAIYYKYQSLHFIF